MKTPTYWHHQWYSDSLLHETAYPLSATSAIFNLSDDCQKLEMRKVMICFDNANFFCAMQIYAIAMQLGSLCCENKQKSIKFKYIYGVKKTWPCNSISYIFCIHLRAVPPWAQLALVVVVFVVAWVPLKKPTNGYMITTHCTCITLLWLVFLPTTVQNDWHHGYLAGLQ